MSNDRWYAMFFTLEIVKVEPRPWGVTPDDLMGLPKLPKGQCPFDAKSKVGREASKETHEER